MTRARRPSKQTGAVLTVLASDAERWWHGYLLVQETGLASGTLYPILLRLADRGYLESTWEDPEGGRPRRHLYRLTARGTALATTSAAHPEHLRSLEPHRNIT